MGAVGNAKKKSIDCDAQVLGGANVVKQWGMKENYENQRNRILW